jgi:hypothetical protein
LETKVFDRKFGNFFANKKSGPLWARLPCLDDLLRYLLLGVAVAAGFTSVFFTSGEEPGLAGDVEGEATGDAAGEPAGVAVAAGVGVETGVFTSGLFSHAVANPMLTAKNVPNKNDLLIVFTSKNS